MRLTPVFVLLAGLLAPAPAILAEGEAPRLVFPLACEIGRTCEVQHYVDRDPGPGAADYRCSHRTYDKHDGVDIRLLNVALQRRGVEVLAAAAGRVARVRDGVPDAILTAGEAALIAGRECGNGVAIDHGGGWETQYCHLAMGSVRVAPGEVVAAGAPIGRVGLSGQTEFPHLHIIVRRAGRAVDPFAPVEGRGVCAAAGSLWSPEAAGVLAYKEGVILNAGFAGGPVTNDTIEAGAIPAPTAASQALVAYMRVIEPDKGDEMEITLTGPDGKVVAAQRLAPLDRDKAQYFAMVGRKRPALGWPPGAYVAELKVWRGGKAVMQRTITTRL